MHDLQARSAWLLVDRAYDCTTTLARLFKERFTQRGGQCMLEDTYQAGETDFSIQIARLKALSAQPDVLFVSAVPNEAGRITQQIREAGLTQAILSGDGFDTPLLAAVAGKHADAVYYATHTSLTNPASRVQHFVRAYTAEYRHTPEDAFAALGYDMMHLIADAIQRAGSTDPKATRDALAATQGWQAVTGTITYKPGQRKPSKSVTIIQVQNGQYTFRKEVAP